VAKYFSAFLLGLRDFVVQSLFQEQAGRPIAFLPRDSEDVPP
jgi:hypothetical protein